MKNYIIKHRYPWEEIKKALRLYKKNKSFRKTSFLLKKEQIYVSHKTIFEWFKKFEDKINIPAYKISNIVKK